MIRQCFSGITYTFRTGDSLSSISRRYNVTIAAISRENPLIDIYNLTPGDEICIPVGFGSRDKVIEYTVKNNETIHTILTKFNLKFEDLLKYNDLATLKLDQGMLLYIPIQDYDSNQI